MDEADEEDTLKDLTLHNIRDVVSQYQLKIAEAVFETFNNDQKENKETGKNDYKKLLNYILNTNEGVLCLHLIKDTLENLGLFYTSSMLEKEIDATTTTDLYEFKSKEKIDEMSKKLLETIHDNNKKKSLINIEKSKIEISDKKNNNTDLSLASSSPLPSVSVSSVILRSSKLNIQESDLHSSHQQESDSHSSHQQEPDSHSSHQQDQIKEDNNNIGTSESNKELPIMLKIVNELLNDI